MSNVETAKALLKKAIALGDNELMELANSLLSHHNSGIKYVCDNCAHTFTSDTVKKSCPSCKKRKLTEVTEPEIPHTVPVAIKGPSGTGIPTRRSGRREPIQVGQFVNTFVDDGSVGREKIDKKITAAIKKGETCPTVRGRPPARLVKVTCAQCSHQFEMSSVLVPPKADKDTQPYVVCSQCAGANK